MDKILVVEDEADLFEELLDLLKYERYQVRGARSGEEAWELLQEDPPDLVLCNIRLQQGLDGYALLERLRNEPALTAIPFVFLTARSASDDIRRAMNLGADDYLIKPVRSLELLDTIRARIRRYRALRNFHRESASLHRQVLLHYFPHEIFTPLNALLGVARVLRRHYPKLLPDRLQQLSDILMRNGLRLFHLLQNQLLYMEIDAWEQDGMPPSLRDSPHEVVSLSQITAMARERAEFYGRQADLTLKLVPAGVIMLEKHFQVVVRELIDNAFKFSPAGTPVLVSSRLLDDSRLQIRVVDGGIGLSPEQIEQIGAYIQFNRQSQEQQGLGLGLMLTRRLMQLYGYTLEIDSTPGRYTQMTLLLGRDPGEV